MGAGTAYSHYLLLFFVHFESNERQGQKGSHQPASHPSPPPKSQKSAWLRSECWAASLPWVLLAFVIFCACGAQTCGFSSPVLWARVMRTCLVCMCQLLRLIKHHRGAPSLSVDQSFPSFFFFLIFFFFSVQLMQRRLLLQMQQRQQQQQQQKTFGHRGSRSVEEFGFNLKSGKREQLICHQVKLPKLSIVFHYKIVQIILAEQTFWLFSMFTSRLSFPPACCWKKKHTTNLHRFGYTWNLNTWTPYVTNCNVTSPFFFSALPPSFPPSLCLSMCPSVGIKCVIVCVSVRLRMSVVMTCVFPDVSKVLQDIWVKCCADVAAWKDGLTGGNRSAVFSLWHEKERGLKNCVGVKCYSSYSKSSRSSGFLS